MEEDQNRQPKRRYNEICRKKKKLGGEGGERDKGYKDREGGMEIHKPREKEKGIG
jgi:hypothetical protein